MKKDKSAKGWSVMFTEGTFNTNDNLLSFIFPDKKMAIQFKGIIKADIVPVIIKQLN